MTTLPEEAVKAAQNELSRIISEWERNREFLNVSPEAMKNFIGRQASALTAALPFLPVQGAVQAAAFKLIERMAFGYEVMFEKLCHISGTSGVDQSWYRAKAREATERLSPLHSITTESNKSVPGDCKRQYQDFMARILSALEPSAPDMGNPITDKTVKMVLAEAIAQVWYQTRDCDVEEIDRIIAHLNRNGLLIVGIQRFKMMADAIQSAAAYLALSQPNSAEKLIADLDAALKTEVGNPATEPSAARELALEEAAKVAERHEGEPCRPAIAWTEEQRQFYASGQQDASSSIASSIRSLSSPDHAEAGKVEGDGWKPGCDRLPTLQEAAFAAKVLNACNGYDLSVWTDDLWPCDDASEGIRAIIAHSALLSAPSGGDRHGE